MKAQMKMMETFAVMVVFFFLLMIGTTMYSRYQERQYFQDLERANKLLSIQTAQKALFLPELKCVEEQLLCFDSLKIEQFNKLVTDHSAFQQSYAELFGDSEITLQQIYPPPGRNFRIYSLMLNPGREIGRSTTIVPVTVYDPTTKTSGFGLLNVTVYQNE